MYKMFLRVPVLIFLFFVMYSCNFGPQPDKNITMVMELEGGSKSDDDINMAIELIKKRISKVSRSFKVERKHKKNQITIEVATHYSAERIKNLMSNPGEFGFYESYNESDILPFLFEVNDLLKKNDSIDPLLDLVKKNRFGGAIILNALEKDTTTINKYLSLKAAESKLPASKQSMQFIWGKKEEYTDFFPLYAVKLGAKGKPVLDQSVIEQANQVFDYMGNPAVTIKMNEEGAKIWEELTGRAFQERFQIAMVINGVVYSAPGVSSGPIAGGKSEITSDFTIEEAQDLAIILNSGSIPKMHIVDFSVEQRIQ